MTRKNLSQTLDEKLMNIKTINLLDSVVSQRFNEMSAVRYRTIIRQFAVHYPLGPTDYLNESEMKKS